MKFYIHPINPHYAATHADDYFKGWHFGIWEHPYPALEPYLYRFQAQHLDAARDTQKKAEDATLHVPNEPITSQWMAVPKNIDPHSDKAAREILGVAAMQAIAVKWPWSEF